MYNCKKICYIYVIIKKLEKAVGVFYICQLEVSSMFSTNLFCTSNMLFIMLM